MTMWDGSFDSKPLTDSERHEKTMLASILCNLNLLLDPPKVESMEYQLYNRYFHLKNYLQERK